MQTTLPSTNGHVRPAQPTLDMPVLTAPPVPPPPPRRRPVLRTLAVVAALGLFGFGATQGWSALQYAEGHESTDDAFIDTHVVNVASRVSGPVVHLYVQDNQLVHQGDRLADVDPNDYEVQLARARAQLETARHHWQTARLQVLVTRQTSSADVEQAASGVGAAESTAQEYETAVNTAATQVETEQARVDQARQQVDVARRQAGQAQAQVAAAQAVADNAHSDLQRSRTLFAQSIVTQQDLDHATNAWRAANAQLEAARQQQASQVAAAQDAQSALRATMHQVQQYQSQVGEARAREVASRAQVGQAQGRLNQAQAAPRQVAVTLSTLDEAAAQVKDAEAAVRQAELSLSYTRIVAAQDGRITKRAIEPGSYVQVGQPLMAVVSPNVWVTANFKETQLAHMRVGQTVDVYVDAYPGHVFHGRVDSFQSGSGAAFSLLPPENATGNYVKVVQRVPVKIVFDTVPAGSYVLGPGMSVVPEVVVK
ncbi:MAG TPA: HlyD family secretion protein [Candidatus Xenobia bacterium]